MPVWVSMAFAAGLPVATAISISAVGACLQANNPSSLGTFLFRVQARSYMEKIRAFAAGVLQLVGKLHQAIRTYSFNGLCGRSVATRTADQWLHRERFQWPLRPECCNGRPWKYNGSEIGFQWPLRPECCNVNKTTFYYTDSRKFQWPLRPECCNIDRFFRHTLILCLFQWPLRPECCNLLVSLPWHSPVAVFQWPLRPECCNTDGHCPGGQNGKVSMAFAAGVLQLPASTSSKPRSPVSMAFAAGVLQPA